MERRPQPCRPRCRARPRARRCPDSDPSRERRWRTPPFDGSRGLKEFAHAQHDGGLGMSASAHAIGCARPRWDEATPRGSPTRRVADPAVTRRDIPDVGRETGAARSRHAAHPIAGARIPLEALGIWIGGAFSQVDDAVPSVGDRCRRRRNTCRPDASGQGHTARRGSSWEHDTQKSKRRARGWRAARAARGGRPLPPFPPGVSGQFRAWSTDSGCDYPWNGLFQGQIAP